MANISRKKATPVNNTYTVEGLQEHFGVSVDVLEQAIEQFGGMPNDEDELKALGSILSTIKQPLTTTKVSKGGSIAKLDTNNLPEVSSLSKAEVAEYLVDLEAIESQGELHNDELIEFMTALYDRQQEDIQYAQAAIAAFRQSGQQYKQVFEELNDTLNDGVDSLKEGEELKQRIAQGGARFRDSFRANRDRRASKFAAFVNHTSGQPDPTTAA